jgi:soluble lytic murein transglycosylase
LSIQIEYRGCDLAPFLKILLPIVTLLVITGCSLDSEPQYVIVTGQPPTRNDLNADNPNPVDGNIGVDTVLLQMETAMYTPTNTANNTAAPEPTNTPTNTPIPTLSIPASELLAQAENLRLLGYYERAADAYRLILAQNDAAPAQDRANAAYWLGYSSLREGFFEDAVGAMTTLITLFPDDPRIPQAHLLRGDAYMGLSRWVEAINDFTIYVAARPGVLDSYIYERIGDSLVALGQTDAAIGNYARAVDSSRSLVPQLALRERVAQVLSGAGRYVDAVAQYDAILGVARNAPYRASMELAAAQTLLRGGDTENAMLRFQKVFDTYPDQAAAYTAVQVLVERGVSVDNYQRGRTAFIYGDYQTAIEAFNQHSTETAAVNINPEMYLLLGRAYREIGNNSAALTAFQTIIDQYATSTVFGQALLEQGRTRFLSGDIPSAIQFYMNIADTYDYLPEAPEALWRAGYLYSTNGEPAQGRLIFERLATEHPNTAQALDGLFLAASAALNTGDPRGAERFYAEITTKTTGEDQASAFLNAGRLALARGETNSGMTNLQQAAQAAPDSYYGARAQDIVNGRQPFATPSGYKFSFDEAAETVEAQNWLRATFGITQEGDLQRLSPSLEADARLQRGAELWIVGAYEEARAEFSDITSEYQGDALASYQLAIYFRDLTAYQNSIVAAANVIIAANVGTLDAPPLIARMRYPIYYLEAVQASAARHDVDPLLLFSLIRHESLFETTATAAAGEKGLTQVIPSTGEYIAGQIGFPDYQHSDLFRPYAGIEFGAYYLGEQLRTFDGNVTAALSGYNAGPGRAINWLEISGGEHDPFMTAISIDSTRFYVQRIYGFYTIYRELYGI